jgi:flagellar biosynthetic protein FlhB
VADETTNQERTQPASPKREQEFKERGDLGRSQEMVTLMLLLTGAACLAFFGPNLATILSDIFRSTLGTLNRSDPLATLKQSFLGSGVALLPLFFVAAVSVVASHVVQGGLTFSTKTITPDWERLNPVEKFKSLLISRQSLVELLKSLLKLVVVGGLVAHLLVRDLPTILELARVSPDRLGQCLFVSTLRLVGFGSIGFAAIALADLLYHRWDVGKRMMMTMEEAKQDMKEQEGDPRLRNKRRQRYRELSFNQILKEVPRADVVVTNPTHLAVALRYDQSEADSPRVVAKGADQQAMRIRAVARKHGIPVLENKPLARILYKTIRVGQAINPTLYQAVAEIYAFLYRHREAARS